MYISIYLRCSLASQDIRLILSDQAKFQLNLIEIFLNTREKYDFNKQKELD